VPEQQPPQAENPQTWDNDRIRVALASARHHARRFARHRRLSRADREDLTQDILLAIVEAADRYDARRASWSTFVALLAQHVVIDRARAPVPIDTVPLDANDCKCIASTLPAAWLDPDLPIALRSAAIEMPGASRTLLDLIVAHRDVVDARDASGVSSATFYRALADLRCWLRSAGAHPSAFTASRP
jgi:DNA-directed RNA polymerase specialized sigma24 family protein